MKYILWSILFLAILSVFVDHRYVTRKYVDLPEFTTTPSDWPQGLPEYVELELHIMDGSLSWKTESIDEGIWHSSRWLFSDIDQAISSSDQNSKLIFCKTALEHFSLIRYREDDNCKRKLGEWRKGLGKLRIEHFTLRGTNIDFVGHCSDWNHKSWFGAIDFQCQAKGTIVRNSESNAGAVYAVLRFPIKNLADIPMKPAN